MLHTTHPPAPLPSARASSTARQFYDGPNAERVGALLVPLFQCLQALTSDERPEVRNSGLRTLVSAMVSHGGQMSLQTWRSCLWEILFPMLDRVRRLAGEASAEVNKGQELGKDKGKAVLLMVHHSRNSAQKQWDETLVLCLNGMGRLLRSHLAVLSSLAGFDQRWSALLEFVEHSILAGSREVGCAAATSLVTVLSAHAGSSSLPGPLWERAMSGLDTTVSRACAPGSPVPGKVRGELVSAVGKLFAARPGAFKSRKDVDLLFGLIETLVRSPYGAP